MANTASHNANVSMLIGEHLTTPQCSRTISRNFEACLKNSTAHGRVMQLDGISLTYENVNRYANFHARHVRDFIVRTRQDSIKTETQVVVAIDVQPSVERIVAMMAVLKLGCAYLPVDSRLPIDRVAYMFNQCTPVCIIADSQSLLHSNAESLWSNFPIYNIEPCRDSPHGDEGKSINLKDEDVLVVQPETAAVLYTSGSTGKPKGVRLSHQNIMYRLQWQWHTFPFQSNEVGIAKTSLLFVDSVAEILGCLLQNVPILVCPQDVVVNTEKFLVTLEKFEITRLVLVPSLLRSILTFLQSSEQQRLQHLNLWVCSGETLPISLLQTFFEIFLVGKQFANFYGSTETTGDITFEVFSSGKDISNKSLGGCLSIGQPLANNSAYIVDENMKIVPLDTEGELIVTGEHIAQGYMNRNEDKNAFTENVWSYSDGDGAKLVYRTGDYAVIHNGRIIYRGRRDLQVKIRGQKVNLAEVEKAILDCQSVKKVVVLAHSFSSTATQIVAYLVTDASAAKQVNEILAEITAELKKLLPTFMLPKLMTLTEIPLQQATGKVDRVKLKSLYEDQLKKDAQLRAASSSLSPSDRVLNIIALHLGLPVDALDNSMSFAENGGDSVSISAIIVNIRKIGMDVAFEDFASTAPISDVLVEITKRAPPTSAELPSSVAATVDEFEIVPLHEYPHLDDVKRMITAGFLDRDPLEPLLGLTPEIFDPASTRSINWGVKDKLSLVLLSKSSGDLIGGVILVRTDVDHPIGNLPPAVDPIFALLDEAETEVLNGLKDKYEKPFVENLMLYVRMDLPADKQLQLCHYLEYLTLQKAIKGDFQGIITVNTNRVTQNICEHFFDYKVMKSVKANTFIYQGRCVFAKAPDDYDVKTTVKIL